MAAEDIVSFEFCHRITNDITDGLKTALMNDLICNHRMNPNLTT